MGGKTWSKEEERMFWGVIVPQSRAAAYPNPNPDDDVKWVQLAQLMQELAGDKARRIYTDTMLFEHFYQNVRGGQPSPKAGEFVQKYLRDEEYFKVHKCRRPPSPDHGSTSSSTPLDPQIAELLKDKPKPKLKTRRPRKGRLPKNREGEEQSSRPFVSMPKSLDEVGVYSSTSANAAEQQISEDATPAGTGAFQLDSYPYSKSALVAVPGSGSVWNRPVQGKESDRRTVPGPAKAPQPGSRVSSNPVVEQTESKYWSQSSGFQRDERPRETVPITSGSRNAQSPQPQVPVHPYSWTAPAPRRQQVSQESRKEWNENLPPLREVLPFVFGRPAHAPGAYDMTRQVDKRNFQNGQGYIQAPGPIPKRRRLPDAPTYRQQDEQQQHRQQN